MVTLTGGVAAEAHGDAAGGAGVALDVIVGGVSERVPTAAGNTVTARAAAKVAAAVAVPVGRQAEVHDDTLTAALDDRKPAIKHIHNHPKIQTTRLKIKVFFSIVTSFSTVNPAAHISLLYKIRRIVQIVLNVLRWNGLPHEDSSEEDEI